MNLTWLSLAQRYPRENWQTKVNLTAVSLSLRLQLIMCSAPRSSIALASTRTNHSSANLLKRTYRIGPSCLPLHQSPDLYISTSTPTMRRHKAGSLSNWTFRPYSCRLNSQQRTRRWITWLERIIGTLAGMCS